MALVTKDFNINITPGEMPPIVHVSEYDIGRAYNVTLIGETGSAFEIPTGTTATVEGTLNGTVGFTTSATISNNQITFALAESMTAQAGKAWCKIKLTLNNQPIQTCAFVLAVDRAGVAADTVIGAPGFEEQIVDAVGEYLEDFVIDDEVVKGAVNGYLDAHSLSPVLRADVNIIGTEHGVVGDGETDDCSAIQTLIDQIAVTASERNSNGNNSLYLPNRTYLISQPLLISDNVHFKCDGKILYNGTGSAVIVDGRYNFIDISMISAPNGTGLELDASRRTHETMSNNIRVGRIRPCTRGIYLHDAEGQHAVTTDYIQCDQIDSGSSSNPGTCGIEVFGDNMWLTEIHFTIGHITNFITGVYLNKCGSIRFHRLHIEGVRDQALLLNNATCCTLENTRIDESYGTYQMVLTGRLNRCEFDLEFAYIDKIDISNLETARYNVFRARSYMISDNSRYIGYEYILTDIPGENIPAFIPIGRTVAVTYGVDSYQTVYNLYKRGISVLLNDASSPTSFALGRVDTTNKIAFFTALYPSASSSDGYIQIWKCQEVDGVTTWTRASEVKIQAQTDKVTTISAASTNTQYPTAKAVWNLVQSMLGNT